MLGRGWRTPKNRSKGVRSKVALAGMTPVLGSGTICTASFEGQRQAWTAGSSERRQDAHRIAPGRSRRPRAAHNEPGAAIRAMMQEVLGRKSTAHWIKGLAVPTRSNEKTLICFKQGKTKEAVQNGVGTNFCRPFVDDPPLSSTVCHPAWPGSTPNGWWPVVEQIVVPFPFPLPAPNPAETPQHRE